MACSMPAAGPEMDRPSRSDVASVVDGLELVDVEECEHERLLCPPRPRHVALQPRAPRSFFTPGSDHPWTRILAPPLPHQRRPTLYRTL